MSALIVSPLDPPPWPEIEPLIAESEREGFHFFRRLHREHEAGTNRFDGPGEVLLGGYAAAGLVAIGGLNRDPYAAHPRTGRLRHLYVRPAYRGQGFGAEMVAALVREAQPHFDLLHLRTDTEAAAAFYERLGFEPVRAGEHATHRLLLFTFARD